MSKLSRATFILLAYNQEAYVAEAIAGALAQDYPDLEIILSDDGSSDGSFAIIEQAVRRYDGPHRVIASRTPVNSGLLAHIYHAVAKASGELIVVAAGDDISLPQRVRVLAEEWQRTGASALFSDWQVIDEQGEFTGRGSKKGERNDLARWFADGQIVMIPGATAAYDRSVFSAIYLPDFPIFCEDAFFSLMLKLRSRRVVHIEQDLVQYRAHGQSLINRPLEKTDLVENERRLEQFSEMVRQTFDYVANAVRTGTGADPAFGTASSSNWPAIQSDLRHARFRTRWIDAPVTGRLAELARVAGSRAKLRWLLPRIGGLTTLRIQRAITAQLRGKR